MPKLINPERTKSEEQASILSSRHLLYFVGTAAAIYLLRASQYLFQPQLYAEDGAVWLADAFNLGLKSLILPYNAFFHTAERLMGSLISPLPLQYAPVIFNITAWLIFIFLIYYLFSPRTKILNNTYQRVFVLISVAMIANVDEFFFNFSNSIFLLGIIGVLILIADESKSIYAKILEKFIFAISCFTLVFAWVYLPIALIEKYQHKRNVNFYLYCAVAGSLAQALSYLSLHVARSSITFQALLSKYTLLEIYNQIAVPAFRFARIDMTFETSGWYGPALVLFVVGLCLLASVYVFRVSNKQVRYLLFFFVVMTAASLKNPLIGSLEPVKAMSVAQWGDRYFIFGIIGLGIVFSKIAFQSLTPQSRYWFLTIFFLFGLATSWHYRSFFIQKNFQDYRGQYTEGVNQLKQGATEVTIPINPNWQMNLRRK